MGLALAAVMGFQSFSLMTHPFASDAISAAGGTGLLAAFIAVVGAAFTLQYLLLAVIGYGLAALIAIATGLNSPFGDLWVWGAGFAVLTVLAALVQFKPSIASAPRSQHGDVPSATLATGALTPSPRFDPAANGSPSGEGDLYGQLERLGRLRASGALDEAEFAQLKANLFSTATADHKPQATN